jgi:hypothetical protein
MSSTCISFQRWVGELVLFSLKKMHWIVELLFILGKNRIFCYALGSSLQDQGERGASPAAAWRRPSEDETARKEGGLMEDVTGRRTPPRQRPVAAPRGRGGEGHALWTVVTGRGSPDATPIFNTTAVTPKTHDCWFRISRFTLVNNFFKFPDQK